MDLLAVTQAEAGYPKRPGNVRAGWIATETELGAWVALGPDGGVVGHVALHPAGGESLALWQTGTGRDEAGIAVVSRLFSAARGAGSALLTRAVDEAALLDRVPVLEVEVASAAYGFYLRRGWTEVGRVTQHWGMPVETAVLVG